MQKEKTRTLERCWLDLEMPIRMHAGDRLPASADTGKNTDACVWCSEKLQTEDSAGDFAAEKLTLRRHSVARIPGSLLRHYCTLNISVQTCTEAKPFRPPAGSPCPDRWLMERAPILVLSKQNVKVDLFFF